MKLHPMVSITWVTSWDIEAIARSTLILLNVLTALAFMAQPSGVHRLFQSIRQQPLLLWPLLSLMIPLWPGCTAPPPKRELLGQELILPSNGEVIFSQPFALDAEAVGATRLFASVGLPVNSAISLTTELLNASDQVVLAFDKEGWRERGTWQEDGQSGIYDESDSYYEVLFKPNQSGQYRLRFAVDGLEDQTGKALVAQLPLRVNVQDRQVDHGLAIWTFWISLGIVCMFLNSIYCQGRRRYGGRIDDLLETSVFTRMDYERGVIMIKLKARYELLPYANPDKISNSSKLPLRMEIIDGNGLILQSEKITLYLNKKSASDEDDPPYWQFKKRLFFYNHKLRSLRFRLSIPERIDCLEQDGIDFDLRDRIVSMRPLNIRRIF